MQYNLPMHHGHLSKMMFAIMVLVTIALVAAGVGMARAQTFTVSRNLCVNLPADLAIGARGQGVTNLQSFLIDEGYLAPNLATGYFGNLTAAALKHYQTSRNVPVTSKADLVTRSSIMLFTCGSSSSDIPHYVPMIRGIFAPAVVKVGQNTTFATIVNNEFSSSFSVRFNWGDGSASAAKTIAAQASHAVLEGHAYTTPGEYSVVVSVSNPTGKTNTSTLVVRVE